jgi:hypothetical protein
MEVRGVASAGNPECLATLKEPQSARAGGLLGRVLALVLSSATTASAFSLLTALHSFIADCRMMSVIHVSLAASYAIQAFRGFA